MLLFTRLMGGVVHADIAIPPRAPSNDTTLIARFDYSNVMAAQSNGIIAGGCQIYLCDRIWRPSTALSVIAVYPNRP